MRRPIIFPIAAAGLALLAACATWGGSAMTTSLPGTEWRLVSAGGRPAAPVQGAHPARLRFEADSGRVSGAGGCNLIGGSYTVAGDSLRFGGMFSTRMACAEEGVSEQETVFLRALDDTRRYSVSGDTLTLIGEGGPVARLVASSAQ